MRTKSLILITALLSLLSINPAFSERIILNDWIYTDSIVSIDDSVFYLKVDKNGDQVAMFVNDKMSIIPNNDCRIINDFNICINSTYADSFNDESRAFITIYQKHPEINMTRTFSKTDFYVGEEIKARLRVSNNGDYEANDFDYYDYYPNEFTLISVTENCFIEGQKIRLKTDLGIGQSLSCDYVLIANSEAKAKLAGEASYTDYSGKSENKRTDAVSLNSKPILTINFLLGKDKFELGYEEITSFFNVTIKNIADEKIIIKEFKITMPEGLDLENGVYVMSKKIYSWKGSLDPNESTTSINVINSTHNESWGLYSKFKPVKSGSQPIMYDVIYEKDGQALEIRNQKINVEITDYGIELLTSIKKNQEIESNIDHLFFLKIQNKNNHTTFKELKFVMNSNFFPQINFVSKDLPPNKIAIISEFEYVTPNLSQSKDYYYEYNLTYYTEFDEKKTINERINFKITPQNTVTITKTISDTSLEEGEQAQITVKIKNNKNTPLYDIYTQEIIPIQLEQYVTGIRTNRTSLEPKEEATLYSYKIKAPDMRNAQNYNITTKVDYQTTRENLTSTTKSSIDYTINLQINPKKPDINVLKTMSKNNPSKGEMVQVSYAISNKDTNKTIKNMIIYFSENFELDLLDDYKYFIDRLEPGEEITIRPEYIIPKINGTINVKESYITFQDLNGNNFNLTTTAHTITASDVSLTGPLLFVNKNSSNLTCKIGDYLNITITITNMGDQTSLFNVTDEELSIPTAPMLKPGSKTTIQKKYVCRIEGTKTFNPSKAYYAVNDKKRIAQSNILKITIQPQEDKTSQTQKTVIITNNEILQQGQLQNDNSSDNPPSLGEDKTTNIIIRFMDWISGLFTKNNP